MARLLIAAALALALLAAPAAAAPRPFVHVVVIDGLDGDAVEEGRAPFISSMLAGHDARGAYYPGSSSVMPAETNPNHVAMMTGAFPGRSGAAANAFALYNPLVSEDSCRAASPEPVFPFQTSGEDPGCVVAETVFESGHRQAGRRRPPSAVIMGKPKLGRIFDVRYRGRRAADYLWAPCTGDPADDPYCADVPTSPVTGYAESDALVMDEVIATIERGVRARGKLRRPRLTFVNLPFVDTAGHTLGRGLVYDAAVGAADDQIERLAAYLKARGEWRRSVLILVSDHSMDTTILKQSLTPALVNAGVPESSFRAVQNGSVDFLYLADRRSPRSERDELLARMRAAALGQAGVSEALYRRPNRADGGSEHTVRSVHPSWTTGKRTGDLVVTTEPGWAFAEPNLVGNPLIGNHGAPHTADNFLAVAGGWRGIRTRTVAPEGRRGRPVNADLAATIMRLQGLRPPRDNAGRALRAAFRPWALRR